jgi:Mrp family chromosome partitioning ATPase
MTLLDRALIKAYAEFAPPTPAREYRQGEAPAHPASARSQAPKPNKTLREHRPPEFPPRSKETLASPAEHLRVSRGVAPLSTFVPPSRTQEPFRALLEVDHLAWPQACDDLLARASAEWECFAERLARQIGQGTKCIALTSCHRGEGRTSVALATAKLLAARGLRSVVVDADFDRPNLADSCGISAQVGWGEAITGEFSLGEALIAATEDRVALLPWLGPRMRAGGWANTLPIATSFSMLRDHYDLVVLDAMPLDMPTAISEFASLAEAIHLDTVYVIFDGRSTVQSSLTDTCAQLRHAGLRVEGLIENFSSTPSAVDTVRTSHTRSPLIPTKRVLPPTD